MSINWALRPLETAGEIKVVESTRRRRGDYPAGTKSANAAGLAPEQLSGHSLRAGYVTAAAGSPSSVRRRVCDISPAAGASGQAPDPDTPLRRHAKTLRHLLFCVPARIVRSARQTIMRVPDGFPHYDIFNATYHAALALPGP